LPVPPEKNIGGTTINELESIIDKVLHDDKMKLKAMGMEPMPLPKFVKRPRIRSWRQKAIDKHWRPKHQSELAEYEENPPYNRVFTFTPSIEDETSRLQYYICRPRYSNRDDYQLPDLIVDSMNKLDKYIIHNCCSRNDEMILMTK
jgi:hypothetical protein